MCERNVWHWRWTMLRNLWWLSQPQYSDAVMCSMMLTCDWKNISRLLESDPNCTSRNNDKPIDLSRPTIPNRVHYWADHLEYGQSPTELEIVGPGTHKTANGRLPCSCILSDLADLYHTLQHSPRRLTAPFWSGKSLYYEQWLVSLKWP